LTIHLKKKAEDGQLLEAVFMPSKGMNLISYKKGGKEVIDQSTRTLFEERFAGLGALIGPHFHHRKPEDICPVPFEERFPHIQRLKAKGVKEPFSHGIARYAPWHCKAEGSSLLANISGNDTMEGVLLSLLEGCNFAMYMDVELRENGLFIELSVESDKPSVIGTHYYYAIENESAYVIAGAQEKYFDGKSLIPVLNEWEDQGKIKVPVKTDLDFGFYPKNSDGYSEVLLHTPSHQVSVRYQSHTEETSFQLFHPKGSSYVCIEPLSATFPRSPKLHCSGVNLQIEIL